MSLEFSIEPWSQFWPDAEPLAAAHRLEVAPQDPRPYVPQPLLAETLVEAGGMFVATARMNGELVGYLMLYLSPQLDAEGLAATQGPWFVAKPWRHGSLAFRLFEFGLAEARKRGARYAFVHHWNTEDSNALDKFFLRKGAVPAERVYVMTLKKEG